MDTALHRPADQQRRKRILAMIAGVMIDSCKRAIAAATQETEATALGRASGNDLGLLKSDSSSCVGCTRVAASLWGGFFLLSAKLVVLWPAQCIPKSS